MGRRPGAPRPPPMSLSKAPPCARHHLLFLCLPRLPFFFPPSFPSSSSLLLYPAGPAGQPALLARHPPAPLQRLARRRLAAQARHRDQRGVGGVGRRGGLGWAGLTVPPALTGVQPGGAPYPTHTSASIQPPPPPPPPLLCISTPAGPKTCRATTRSCWRPPSSAWCCRATGGAPAWMMPRCTAASRSSSWCAALRCAALCTLCCTPWSGSLLRAGTSVLVGLLRRPARQPAAAPARPAHTSPPLPPIPYRTG